MRRFIFFTFCSALTTSFVLTTLAHAQAPQQPPLQNLPASTVQLPTFSIFNVTTTVSVPDRGSISLAGGVDRGVDATVNRSPIRSRTTSSSRAASGMSVHATIIDHSELDRAVLAAAAAKRGADSTAVAVGGGVAVGREANHGLSATIREPSPDSVAAIRERAASAADLESQELAGYFAKGRQAESEGKPVVARIFYDMVARRDRGPLKQQALTRLAALPPAAATRQPSSADGK
jgi:hypothetical protein